ncbi:MAG TPA: N-acetyl-gamma-glutamyl-phosphate reductase [Streptosporangiaceae bacterium]
MIEAAVVGASGYIGGELLRILLGHPRVRVAAATSGRFAGRRVDGRHPNLRGRTDLTFLPLDRLGDHDVLFLATPHRETMLGMPDFLRRAGCVIDLSADFRLRDPDVYARYYGVPHAAPALLPTFRRGLPELWRGELRAADRISVPGCMATAAILALAPVADGGLAAGAVTVDARTGSSGAGAAAGADGGAANAHAERSGALRVFAPTGHRHQAEVAQATGLAVRFAATGVEAVRGVQVVCRFALVAGADEAAVRAAFRQRYAAEPFVRIVAHRRGLYRYPEPKILSGSNYCDVGFAVDAEAGEATVIGALDNLVKGGAGNAVQCLNVRFGWPEPTGLEFPGLHPN